MSQTKITTYLLYAVGEILLVVIGILIAVSIDDWNQARKDKQAEKQYLTNLLPDLELQLSEAEGCIQSETANATYIRLIGEQIQNGFADTDIETLNIQLTKAMVNRSLNIYNATFDELKATGNIRLISNQELKTNIISYYESLNRANLVLNKYEEQTTTTLTDLLLTADLLNFDIQFEKINSALGTNFLIKSGEPIGNPVVDSLAKYDFQKISLNNLKSPDGAFRLKNVISARYFIVLVALVNFNQIKAATESLKEQIQNELNKL